MSISVINTADGSTTLFNSELNEHYHSIHGALTESLHVFLQHGFVPASAITNQTIRILEVGFGTGLNAVLTASAAEDYPTTYTALEPFPVSNELIAALNYENVLDEKQKKYFKTIHEGNWHEQLNIHPSFSIEKVKKGILDFNSNQLFHLIYFDAFAPEKQPEMWDLSVLQKCYSLLEKSGIFSTYCAKGQFKRDLKQCGFHVEGRPGPPFKREITFAVKF